MKKNVLIVGAGGVAHVAAHKAAMNNELLGDICIASRTLSKCDEIIESVKRKGHVQNSANKLYSRQIDALDIPATGQADQGDATRDRDQSRHRRFINMSILEACLETGAVYLHGHRDPRGAGQGLRNAALVRQLRVETQGSLHGKGRDRHFGRRASTRAWSTPTARWRRSGISTRSTPSTFWMSTREATASISPPISIPKSISASSRKCGPGSTASGRNIRPLGQAGLRLPGRRALPHLPERAR